MTAPLEFETYADSRILYVTCRHLMTMYESDESDDDRMVLAGLHHHDQQTGCCCSRTIWLQWRQRSV